MLMSAWLTAVRNRLNGNRIPSRRRGTLRPQNGLEDSLETRALLAAPTLVAVRPNVGDFLDPGEVRNVAPRELTLQFNPGQQIDDSNDRLLVDSPISVTRSGRDGVFGDGNDIPVTLGYVGLGANAEEVVVRFAENLPDDYYRITIRGGGTNPLQNTAGEVFESGTSEEDGAFDFRLNLAAQVRSVVPQPITRNGDGTLTQARSQVVVYFNEDTLDQASAEDPAFYSLYFTNDTIENTDDASFSPASVSYDSATNTAVLDFGSDIDTLGGAGTYRLRIGTSETIPAAPSQLDFVETFNEDFGSAGAAFVSIVPIVSIDGDPVSLNITTAALPQTTPQITVVGRAINVVLDTGGTTASQLAWGINLHPEASQLVQAAVKGDLNFAIGTTAAAALNFSFDDAGSSFDDAHDLGSLGGGTQVINGQVLSRDYPFDFPGNSDEPGHREIDVPEESHLEFAPDTDSQITTLFYNFQSNYGFNPQGQALSNLITENQKTRAREIFSLFARRLGVQFVETENLGFTIVTGDLRAIDPDIITGAGGVLGQSSRDLNLAIMDNAETWDDSYGGSWFTTAMHEIGHLLGLGHAFDLPVLTVMGDVEGPTLPAPASEPVFPGDADVIHGQVLYRPESRDIDLYRFSLSQKGQLTAETIAERIADSSLLDTVLRLYRVNSFGQKVLVSQNDDYFSEDSLLNLELDAGTYFIGVSASGNDDYDPVIRDSGMNGTTQGEYQLRVTFRPDADNAILDSDPVLPAQRLDGDNDGVEGGVYNFWFRAVDAADQIVVDKLNAVGTNLPVVHDNIRTALSAAGPGSVVRIVGNGGADDDVSTKDDNIPYQIGLDDNGFHLADGADLNVPADVVLMIDAGTIIKFQDSYIGVGSSSVTEDRGGATLQVLGTPFSDVTLTSWRDETVAGDTTPIPTTPAPGNWGGIMFQRDVDNQEGRKNYERLGVFMDHVAFASMHFGGGKLSVDSVEQIISPISMIGARPGIYNNTITNSEDSAMSADPDSFEETLFSTPGYQSVSFTPDYSRVGPDIYGNTLVDNSNNGLFVRIQTNSGSPTKELTVAGRFDDRDIVHIVSENLVVRGTPGGPFLEVDAPPVLLVTVTEVAGGGTLAAGTYNYRLVYLDAAGVESPASSVTRDVVVTAANGAVDLANLPTAVAPYTARRLYRSDSTGGGAYQLVATLNSSSRTFRDTGTTESRVLDDSQVGRKRARLDASLVIDPNLVIKLEGARIEVGHGAQLIAEALRGQEIIVTSRLDDRYGVGGTFDTNNDDRQGSGEAAPDRDAGTGLWGGIYLSPGSSASIDNALVTFGGNVIPTSGDFAGFNVIEAHQAALRITNSVFEQNRGGTGGTAPADRFGYTANAAGTIFARGAQPILIDNVFRDNDSGVLSINANSFVAVEQGDYGRVTGLIDVKAGFEANHGPLLVRNLLGRNAVNGIVVRGEELTTETVWDDNDIVHVLQDEVLIPNFHTYGGLRLTSAPDSSLVIKLAGNNAGFTAGGKPLDIEDRIGGVLQVVGQPFFPVVLTSLSDDSVGAGFGLDGLPLRDTNADGLSAGSAGDWRSILVSQFAHDRNVAVYLENEVVDATDPGNNATARLAEFIGELGRQDDVLRNSDGTTTIRNTGDESLRLGFEVHGVIDSPNDVDVYSFTGKAGTEVWVDIDRTTHSLDTVVELISSTGNIIALSDSSLAEASDPAQIYRSSSLVDANPLGKSQFNSDDLYTTNQRDAGFRVVLPGNAGTTGTYQIRVRSSNVDPLDPAANFNDLTDPTKVFDGLTSGSYQMQVRLQETDEVPGTTVWFSDIRFATNGIEIFGQPVHSPLSGEFAEGTSNNDIPQGVGQQNVGNILNTDRAAVSIAGRISSPTDVDFYRFSVRFDDIQDIPEHTNPDRFASVTFDVDYADGMSRANLQAYIFDAQTNQLILTSRDSNIGDDRSGPLEGADMDDLSRGSVGELDPFIGPFELPEGDYQLVVAPHSVVPLAFDQFSFANSANQQIRLEPITAVTRVIDEHFGGSTNSTAPLYQFADDEQGQNTVQYHLGDVPLFVSTGRNVFLANSFTGTVTNTVGDTIIPHAEIMMRPDGELFAWSLGGDDSSAGNYLRINTGDASVTNLGDDGIVTFHDSDADPGEITVTGSNAGMQVTAFAYTPPIAPGANGGILVGTRGDGRYQSNLIYQFNTLTGAAISQGDLRTDDARVNDQDFSTPVSPNLSGTDVREIGMINIPGTVTGIAMPSPLQMFGVTDQGTLFEFDMITRSISRQTVITNAFGLPANLTGLTFGPDEVEGGLYFNTLFVSDSTGDIYALGAGPGMGPNLIEPTAGFGDEIPVFVDGQTVMSTGIGAQGITFGTLEYNLWATTINRADDVGHGIPEAFDGTRAEAPGLGSLYFGNQRGGQSAGNKNDLGSAGVVNDYNFPGGAHGTFLSNVFSLEGYASQDKPTLYFNYLLETDSNDYDPALNRSMSDALRVYVGDGTNWSLVATNDSFRGELLGDDEFDFGPNGLTTFPSQQLYPDVVELFDEAATPVWRQARIDLSSFAGESELRLRFEFATAGSVNVGDINTVGEEFYSRDGSVLRDGQSYILEGVNQFEIDMGFSLVVPSFNGLSDGDTISVDVGGTVETLELDTGGGVTGGNVAVPIDSEMTSSEIARAIERGLTGLIDSAPGGSPWEELQVHRNLNRINLVRQPAAPAPLQTTGIDVNATGGILVEGAPGVTPGTTPVVVHAGMSRFEIADVIANALADHHLPAGVYYEAEFNNAANPFVATDLEALSWTTAANNTIEEGSATPQPHISMIATSDIIGGTDFYRFEVSAANAAVRIDLDGITDPNYMPILRLLDSTGALIFETDAGTGLDIGSNQTEATIERNLPAGEYYIQTGTSPRAGGAFPTARYTLHVSVEGHAVNAGPSPAAALSVPRHIVKNSGDLVRMIGHYVTNAGPMGHTVGLQGDGFGGYFDTINTAQKGMNNAFEGVYIDDIIIGAAERGEMVFNAPGNSSQFIANPELENAALSNTNPYQDILEGAYDVEIRRSEDYASTTLVGLSPNPQFATIDTNARLNDSVSIRVADAGGLRDGQTINISDGVNDVTFEFEDARFSDGVAMGHYAILFDPTVDATLDPRFESQAYVTSESAGVIAARVRDAINSTEVQGILKIRASLADGTDSADEDSTSAVVNLYGNAIVSLTDGVQQPESSAMPDGIDGRLGAVSGTSSSAFFQFQNTTSYIDPVTGYPEQIESIRIQLPGSRSFDPTPLIGGTGSGPSITAASDFDTPTFTTLDATNPRVPQFDFSDNMNELTVSFDLSVLATQDGPGFERGDLLAFGIDVDFANEPIWALGTIVEVTWNSGRTATSQFVKSPGTEQVAVLRSIEDTNVVIFHEGEGDANRKRDQGQMLIQSNFISDSAQWGILSDAGVRTGGPNPPGAGAIPHAGPVRNLREPNTSALVPGIVISNNVVSNGGTGGIRFSGEIAPGNGSAAPVPYGRIINNTVVGNSGNPRGVGIQVDQNASPTLLNNIVADLATGISVDAGSQALGTVLGATLYRGNNNNAATGSIGLGTYPILLGAADPLFVDQGRRNFYPAPSSQAIDSSVDALSDRTSIVTVRQPLGIGLSPIKAPLKDAYGQLRGDDPDVATPAVQGANVFKDRGAVDAVDFFDPGAILSTPLDQGDDDLEVAINSAWLNEPESLREIILTLTDVGIGIDDEAVLLDGSQFQLYMDDGVKQPTDLPDLPDGTVITEGLLTPGVDYVFVYNSTTNEVIFRSTTAFPFERNYRIDVNNDDDSSDGVDGIRDMAGNYLAANRTDGSTQFTLLLTDGVNDPPVNTVPGDQTTDEDTALVFSDANSNVISVSDADVWLGTNILEVTLSVTNGTLTLSDTTGLTFSAGDGTDDASMTFRGRVEALNRALDGMSYAPTPDFFGSAVLTITTDDLGGFTGPPGAAPAAEQDTDTVNITVNSVNDPPTFDIPNPSVSVNEDVGTVTVNDFFTNAVAGPPNETESITFSFTGTVTTGAWAGTPLTTFFSTPLTAIQSTTDPTNWHLTFQTAPDVNGTVSVTARANDGFIGSAPVNFEITVNAVNDAPVYVISTGATVNAGRIEVASDEDAGPVRFVLFDSFAPGPATALDEVGQSVTWSVQNVVPDATPLVSNLQFVAGTPRTDVSGDLIYQSTADTAGRATLDMVLTDSGPTGGANVSSSTPQGVDVTVNQINDAPVAVTGGPYTVDDGYTLTLNASGSSDVDQFFGQTLKYEWDLNDDGTYETSSNGGNDAVFNVTWAELSALGITSPDEFSIRLRVTDSSGATNNSDVDTTTLETLIVDYGDAAATFGSLRASGGAAHTIDPDTMLYLGSSVDHEQDAAVSAAADGDDIAGTDDEDGVSFPIRLESDPGTDLPAYVDLTVVGEGFVDAWMDLNDDGDFDTDERLTDAAGKSVNTGSYRLFFTIPAGTPVGVKNLRFRISSTGGLDATGRADDGEVEDYRHEVVALVGPGTPVITHPIDVSPGNSVPPQTSDTTPYIAWTRLAQNFYYQVDVYSISDLSSPVYSSGTIDTESHDVATSLPDGLYRVLVTPFNKAAVAGTPAEYDFEVVRVQVASPAGDINSGQPELRWNHVLETRSYIVTVNSLTTQTNVIQTQFNTAGLSDPSSYQVSFDLPIGRYETIVQAVDQDNRPGDPSAPLNFFVRTAPVVTSPSVVIAPRPQLTWTPVAGAANYEVELFDLTQDVLIANVGGVTSTSWTPPVDLTLGEYTFRVRAFNSDGEDGFWSNPARFGYQPGVEMISPVFERLSDSTPTFVWNAVADADYYSLVVRQNFGSGAEVIRQDRLTSTFWTSPNELDLGRYKYTLTAVNESAIAGVPDYSVSSNLITFTQSQRPLMTSPLATTFDARPVANWTIPTGGGLAPSSDIWLNQLKGATSENILKDFNVPNDQWQVPQDLGIGTYQIWVRTHSAVDSATVSDWSLQKVFRVTTPPTPLGPAGRTDDSTPGLSWEGVQGGDTYRVYVSSLSAGGPALYDVSGIDALSYTVPDELPIGRYRYWVKATSAFGDQSAWSAPQDFQVVTSPVLSGPSSATFDTTPTFDWTDMSAVLSNGRPGGATEYDFRLDQLVGTTRNAFYIFSNQTETSFTVPADQALPVGIYQAYVRARSADTQGDYSVRLEFFVGGRPVVHQIPVGTSEQPLITWDGVDGASSYQVFIANTLDPSKAIINEGGLASTTYQPDFALGKGTFRVWIRAFRADNGQPGLWSKPVDFTIVAAETDADSFSTGGVDIAGADDLLQPTMASISVGMLQGENATTSVSAESSEAAELSVEFMQQPESRDVELTEDVLADWQNEAWWEEASTDLAVSVPATTSSATPAVPAQRESLVGSVLGSVLGLVATRRRRSEEDAEA